MPESGELSDNEQPEMVPEQPVAKRQETTAAGSERFTSHQWIILIVINVATLTSAFCVCLFPPYFPKLAESKGVSASVYGFIIGVNCLISFILTPLIGDKVGRYGLKLCLSGGLLVSGAACVLLGVLEYIEDKNAFICSAVALRAVQASGNAFVIVAQFAYSAEFPGSVGKIYSWTRTVTNVGQMLGPLLGGLMIDVGGFYLPFVVTGGLQMIMLIPIVCFLPSAEAVEETPPEPTPNWGYSRPGFVKLLSFASIWVSFLTVIISTMTNGFLSVTLEPQVLRSFGLSHMLIGVAFGCKDGFNSIASPIWGHLCDTYMKFFKVMLIVGALMVAACFFMIGPFPGLDYHPTLTVVIIALAIDGMGIAGQQVPGLLDALQEAIKHGFPNSAETHGMVAGVWSSLSGAGRFVSRCMAGVLVDYLGFSLSAALFVTLELIVVVTAFIAFLYSRKHRLACIPRKSVLLIEDNNQITATVPESPVASLQTKSIAVSRLHRNSSLLRSREISKSVSIQAMM